MEMDKNLVMMKVITERYKPIDIKKHQREREREK